MFAGDIRRNAARLDVPRRRVLNLLVHSLMFVEVLGEAETFDVDAPKKSDTR